MKRFRHFVLLPAIIIAAVILLTVSACAEGISEATWQAPEVRKDETGLWDYGVLEDGTAVITGFAIDGTTLKIPETVDGIPVTMIARAPLEKPDYSKMRAVRKVVLPKGLKVIGQRAFEFFAAMTSVNIPDSVEVIGYAAFKDCQALGQVTIPEGVRTIGTEAFRGCGKLAFPKLPSTLERIEAYAFYLCRKAGKVTLPASVRFVGEMAFGNCEIRALTMNEGLEEIGDYAFVSHNLNEIIFPASLQKIGNAAFVPLNPKNLKKVTFNGIATEPGIGVFGYDDGYDAYRKNALKNDSGAKAEDYDKKDPANWTDYYRTTHYYSAEPLTVICYPGSKADQAYQFNVKKSYLKVTQEAVTAPAERVLQAGLYTNDDLVYELVVPEGVEEIADSAFAGLATLNRITLPATLTKIGAHAFEGCIGLKEIDIQAKEMTGIGEAAFKGCSELKSITILEGITEIGNSTFEGCQKLEKVKMPKAGVTRIGDNAFADCAALTGLQLTAGLESIGKKAFLRCGWKDAQIPDTVTSIGDRAFYSGSMTKLKLPAGMEEIGDYLCGYCMNLSDVTLPKTLKRIGKCAFIRCPLTKMTLPEGLVSIGEQAFAFDAAYALKQYGRNKTVSRLRSVNFPDSLEEIGKEAFLANDGLTAISFSKNARLREIGERAFASCYRLKNIALPDSLQKIGSEAFRECVQMTRADLGKGITALGDKAFYYCPKMLSMTVPDTLKEIGQDVLTNHGKKLKVTTPQDSPFHQYLKEHYKNVTVLYPKK